MHILRPKIFASVPCNWICISLPRLASIAHRLHITGLSNSLYAAIITSIRAVFVKGYKTFRLISVRL
jgi:hypothetical protein